MGSDNARLVVLGSMPGVASLEENQYYAHPRNAFWPIMQAIFGGSIDSYDDKRQILTDSGIVIWDVLAQCVRPGSLDSSIRSNSVVCNDFSAFLHAHPQASRIAFNGKASEQLFRKHALPTLEIDFYAGKQPAPANVTAARQIQLLSLPSTSPAMASLDQQGKIVAWSEALLQSNDVSPIADNQV